MHPSLPRRLSSHVVLLGLVLFTCPAVLAQSTSGRMLGRVSDPSGAVLPSVNITLSNESTGVNRATQTNSSGDYVFVEVQPGSYALSFEQKGFKTNVRKGISVDVNQVVTLNVNMQVGETRETVEVTSEAPLVDTTSTQLGAVVNERSVNELPLNTRDTYQFLQLQPGVQSQLGGSGDLFYGSDKAGTVSVNGGRGRANNFSVNGGDANDQFANLPTVQPTPDAIEEFRVLTNTFDAEYGRNSGAVVNVITKSGSNTFHGNLYEYFRNKVLNARGFFDTVKPAFNQNQFGGTFGGPIKKDRTFFFLSYEGRRIRQGKSSDTVAVPTALERTGDFSAGSPFGGAITDSFVGQVLNGRPGCSAAIAALGGTSPASSVNWGGPGGVFPTNVIPTQCMDPVALDLMNKYVPLPNTSSGFFQTVPTGRDRQDQVTWRFDHRINAKQNFSGYYYFTDEDLFQPFAFFQAAGANIPGFGSLLGQRLQQYNLSHTWTISNAVVNEARFAYMREAQRTFQHPQHTNLVTASCDSSVAQFCFTGTSDSGAITSAFGTSPKLGITPNLGTNREGVPFITVSGGFIIGNNFEGELPQVGNSFQWSNNLTWVRGNHTMKFGVDIRRQRFDQTLYFAVSGDMTINSSTSNSVGFSDNYPSYLLGLVDSYGQGSAQVERVRSSGVYLFAQDSWKIKPNLTLNYGLRWELDTPLVDVSQHVQTFRAGQNTTIYPCQLNAADVVMFQGLGISNPDCNNTGVTPTGLVVPGDKGIPPGMTQTYYKAFAPRIGIAYSPDNGKTSIRAGWGMFYNPIEQLVLEQFSAEPPFGGSSFFSSTFFNTPFVAQANFVNPNPFNGILNPPRGSPVDWSVFRPILLFGEFQPRMRTQYSAQYNLNIQRELSHDMVFQIGYVGSQGHRLLAAHDLNAANPQTCLDLNNTQIVSNVTSFGSASGCGPLLEDNQYSLMVNAGQVFHMPNGTTITGGPAGTSLQFVGMRPYSSPNCNSLTGVGCPVDSVPVFTNIFALDTIAASSYNSLQSSLEKRFSHGLQLQAAYTFSKSFDWTSSFEETLNPFNFPSNRSLSLFDSRHRFVLSYYWDLPVPRHTGLLSKLVNDWAISGITAFQSGFPVRLQTQDDNELISSLFFAGTGAPQLTGPFKILNPKNNPTNLYFDPTVFSDPPLGHFATTKRTICCGPGTNNWDFSVHKKIAVDETRYFQFRAEIFNLVNHTQFFNPDGNFSDAAAFGRVTRARDPRLIQLALKFFF